MTPARYIGDKTSPAQRRRIKWGERLAEQIKFVGWEPKRFRYELAQAGLEVSRQAVECWLAGKYAPSVENQAVIAKVLRTAPHILFPADAA